MACLTSWKASRIKSRTQEKGCTSHHPRPLLDQPPFGNSSSVLSIPGDERTLERAAKCVTPTPHTTHTKYPHTSGASNAGEFGVRSLKSLLILPTRSSQNAGMTRSHPLNLSAMQEWKGGQGGVIVDGATPVSLFPKGERASSQNSNAQRRTVKPSGYQSSSLSSNRLSSTAQCGIRISRSRLVRNLGRWPCFMGMPCLQ